MATWTNIPDASLEPEAPARSVDALALRDNPVAIAQWADNAPAMNIVPRVTLITSTGTWSPPSGVRYIRVIIAAGGGGGGGTTNGGVGNVTLFYLGASFALASKRMQAFGGGAGQSGASGQGGACGAADIFTPEGTVFFIGRTAASGVTRGQTTSACIGGASYFGAAFSAGALRSQGGQSATTSGGGGGGGGVAEAVFETQPSDVWNIIIGTGGSAGSGAQPGQPGAALIYY